MSLAVRRQTPFSIWLRTGLWPVEVPEVETKYNHWHDVENGQFTTVGSGRPDGSWQGGGFTGGGGGSGGGGGASGSWGSDFAGGGGGKFDGGGSSGSWGQPKVRRTAVPRAGLGARKSGAAVIPSSPKASGAVRNREAARGLIMTRPAVAGDALDRIESRNGYGFSIDGEGRTSQVTGSITLKTATRSRSAQSSAGGSDRLATDDGGHYIAARFNGPSDAFNHFAQDANFNRGGYRALENEWARDRRAGKIVSVTIIPLYAGSSQRPSRLYIRYVVNGTVKRASFENERRAEKRRGR